MGGYIYPRESNRCNLPFHSPTVTMSTTTTTTTTTGLAQGSLSLPIVGKEGYKYAHLLPTFPKDEHYPPLTPFEHVDPGHRALKHADPRSFLKDAKVTQLTPTIGEEVRGVNLATLDNDAKDQLALEVSICALSSDHLLMQPYQVAKQKVIVFRDQQDFIDSDPEAYLEFGESQFAHR